MAAQLMDETKILSEALSTVKIQVAQMKRYLETDELMDALKSASTMLAELRTSSLTPKQYYELYLAVFDALRHLSTYLYDAHTQGRHHLADLYELVQYAGNIVPRLYLMITVGSVYMSIPEAPIKEIMKDMMEMSRGVQHPTRGLFLRHYLSGQTRDHLPVGDSDGPQGNLQDSINFVLFNFVEMNKLWVRLQHQGHSRERERRELERRELRILVGTNLVRLSQLDGVDMEMYTKTILPGVLEQVVNCKDVIAQEYLMEVVIQVFTDEFHLHTLGPFLTATAQLHPKVNIKSIVIALIDRLAAYAAREAENENPEETKRQEEAAAKRLAERVKAARQQNGEPRSPSAVQAGASEWGGAAASVNGSTSIPSTPVVSSQLSTDGEKTPDKGKEKESTTPKKFRGIPDDVKLFEVFWHQVVELIKARPDLSIQDITALLVSLTNLSLSCYPDRLEYVDQILGFAQAKIKEFADSPDLHNPQTNGYLASLLLAPINNYQSVLTLLALPQYVPLLTLQPFSTRRSLAHAIISSVLKNETIFETPEDVDGVLELCHVLIKDQTDSGSDLAPQPYPKEPRRGPPPQPAATYEELAEEQGWVARMVHLFRSDSLKTQYELLQAARRQFDLGAHRMRYTFPSLISASIKLARRYKGREDLEDDWHGKVATILKFIRELTSILAYQVEAPSIALRLFLLAAQVADECQFEDFAYDFYVQAFTVYEEGISESRGQLQAITLIIGTLQGAKVFGPDNYDTLITKAALHGSRLLKKPHQSTAVQLASHLWWQQSFDKDPVTETEIGKGESAEGVKAFPHADSKRVLECLQKSLRIANSANSEIVTVQLYCDALDQYLYYMDRGANTVTPKFVNSLVELITGSIDNISSPDVHPSVRAPSGLVEGVQTPEMITRHFRNTLLYIQSRKQHAEGASSSRWGEVDIVGASLKLDIGNNGR
ncbi:vacuolar protein sorting-associated protein 35 [Sistotremastrum suecicum HHB10207 ss-3]|uniref:Vacuolar protein sorting-associated protein 35 n=1 Tax=Sistotremastrum suecicum HHB10207 ss-3 TaxID=1314776 RepID=A0A166HKI6_9AGAM|nr:vacuolar protein sorting-associated protein 35 [Sistotremastrum suecicum HHB10207 ss-3]